MSIGENIKHIQKLKEDAARRAGRSGEEVLLVAVTKLHSADEINEAIDCGITDIGENKVQEIMDKYEKVKPVRWHLIGHLQTNKVKYIRDKVAMIHSVDSLHLAKEIDKRARQHGLVMDILIQVNSAMEESKFGITTEETGKMIDDILRECPNIRIRGLMCIAPFEDNPDDARVYFAEVKKLYDEYAKVHHPNLDFKYLSMGMSNDFEVAVRGRFKSYTGRHFYLRSERLFQKNGLNTRRKLIMGISDTFKKLVGIEEVEDDFDDEELEAEKERISRESVRKPQTEYKAPKAMGDTTKAVPIDRRISVAGTSAFKLVVIEPKSFDAVP